MKQLNFMALGVVYEIFKKVLRWNISFGLAGSVCLWGGGTSTTTLSGNAVLGPLQSAIAFIDYDGSGTLDTATEPYTFTDSAGAFSLSSTQGPQKVVVTTDSTAAGSLSVGAIDGSSGTALSGVTITGPSGASVISPASTLLEKGSLTGQKWQRLWVLRVFRLLSSTPMLPVLMRTTL